MKECPCKGCVPPKRSITCHSNCKAYETWSKENEKKNALIRKNKQVQ